ncbi:DUF6098 family protein [Streptomyces mutabilis]|uniref:DUF6098 family protein n=1 Tax=Streptomyces mutabilis TaxID=67332 RepID=UPI0034D627B8
MGRVAGGAVTPRTDRPRPADRGRYVRWSRGPGTDLTDVSGTGGLTGVPMPGLRQTPRGGGLVGVPPVRVWAARRLHDYAHLPHDKGPRRPGLGVHRP